MRSILLIFIVIGSPSSKAEINFFNSEIDFWSNQKSKKTKVVNKSKKEFDWEKYKNVENDEFFKEGNHIPPKPFMEVARRPTESNIKNWLEYIQNKNDIQRRFLTALRKYKSSMNLEPKAIQVLEQKETQLLPVPLTQKKISVTTYFLTTCPACKRMFKTLEALQKKGVYVEAIQIDSDKEMKRGVSVPVYKANKKEKDGLIKAGIGVPYSIVRIGNKAFPLSGYHTVSSILSVVNKKY